VFVHRKWGRSIPHYIQNWDKVETPEEIEDHRRFLEWLESGKRKRRKTFIEKLSEALGE
jgi:hypothetical protein